METATDPLRALERLIGALPPDEIAELDRLLEPELSAIWRPNPGPQLEALNSQADLLLYGGAAGGGKTDLLIGAALTTQFRSVIFRRAYVDLRGVEERLIEVIGGRDGYNASDMVLKRDGRVLEFGALEKPGSELSWQGRPHDLIGFDEGAQLQEAKVAFVLGWLRSADGHRCRAIIASNPPLAGEGVWLLEWFAPWLDPVFPKPARPGELRWCVRVGGKTVWVDGPEPVSIDGEMRTPLSRTFIPSKLNDNPYLRDTDYRSRLQAMDEQLQRALLGGDFMAFREDRPDQIIPAEWVRLAQERWAKGRPAAARMVTLGVDVAQGGSDKTVLAPLYGTWFGPLKIFDGIDTKDGPAVAARVVQELRDGARVHIDLTGGWGGSARDHLMSSRVPTLGVVFSSGSGAATKDGKFGFFNLRAEMYWKLREALDPNGGDAIALPDDRILAAELTAPSWKLKGTRIVVESKDDIRKRLGSSTDRADAIVLAWYRRAEALAVARHAAAGSFQTAEPMADPLA